MSGIHNLPEYHDGAGLYEIRLKGHLDDRWGDRFEGLTITLREDGDTFLSGPVADQAALHGLLKRIRDLGIPLVSVNRVQFNETHPYHSKKEMKMKTYRMNAVMAGAFYFLGTVMGIFAIVVAGQSSAGDVSVNLGAAPSRLILGGFFIMLMGVLLSAMTVFLYPLFRKDSKELAMGMVLSRGALEGAGYIIAALLWVLLAALSKEFAGTDSATLHTVGNLVLEVSNKNGDLQTVFFIIGAMCLYTSFYRTRLIPRWLTLWGMIGAVPYVVYGLLSLFDIGGAGLGFLQLPLFFQELAMGLWLVIKGFNQDAVKKLDGAH